MRFLRPLPLLHCLTVGRYCTVTALLSSLSKSKMTARRLTSQYTRSDCGCGDVGTRYCGDIYIRSSGDGVGTRCCGGGGIRRRGGPTISYSAIILEILL